MTKENSKSTIEMLEESASRIEKLENVVYFLTYDTKNHARAGVKHIYDMALALRKHGFNSKILIEDSSYGGIKDWAGDEYDELPVVSIKEDKVEINLDDTLVVPEVYSNVLPQLSNIKCIKILLVQQKEYVFDTLPIGSKWSDFGFDKCITTTESTKKYINKYFPEAFVYLIPPFIGDVFSPTTKPQKPYISISCRDRSVHRKIISEFYLRYPHLRWITFRDMVQMTYEEFADVLKECMASVWIDEESTFGTFPLESMKCGVPVIGKVPITEPDWLGDNGIWTYDVNKITELLGSFVMAWVDGVGLDDEAKSKILSTPEIYNKENHNQSTLKIFGTFINQRLDTIKDNIEKLKTTK